MNIALISGSFALVGFVLGAVLMALWFRFVDRSHDSDDETWDIKANVTESEYAEGISDQKQIELNVVLLADSLANALDMIADLFKDHGTKPTDDKEG